MTEISTFIYNGHYSPYIQFNDKNYKDDLIKSIKYNDLKLFKQLYRKHKFDLNIPVMLNLIPYYILEMICLEITCRHSIGIIDLGDEFRTIRNLDKLNLNRYKFIKFLIKNASNIIRNYLYFPIYPSVFGNQYLNKFCKLASIMINHNLSYICENIEVNVFRNFNYYGNGHLPYIDINNIKKIYIQSIIAFIVLLRNCHVRLDLVLDLLENFSIFKINITDLWSSLPNDKLCIK